MARKHHPPFDDDGRGVPESAWVALMLRVPSVFEAVWQLKQEHMALLNMPASRTQRCRAQKKWLRSSAGEALSAVIQLEFHYSESTFKTRDQLWRAMKHYRNHRDKIINRSSING